MTALLTELRLRFLPPTMNTRTNRGHKITKNSSQTHVCWKLGHVFPSCCYNTNGCLCSRHWRKLSLLLHLTLKVPAVTICTAQRSLYVPHSGHYMYRTAVNICTAQRSLYVPHSGHYMYCTVVTICPTSLTYTILRSAHTVYLCVLCGSENKQRLFPYTTLTDWFV